MNESVDFTGIPEENFGKIKMIGGETAGAILLAVGRMTNTSEIRYMVEESGEMYVLEFRKIADLDPGSSKPTDQSIAENIKVSIADEKK